MSLVDRFVCRREGHIPSMTVKSGGCFVTSYVCTCTRCGKYIEVPGDHPDAPRADPRIGGGSLTTGERRSE